MQKADSSHSSWDANLPTVADFRWPNGVRAAASLSFDDGRRSQIERGIPLLNQYGVKATFYVVPRAVEIHTDQWISALAAGHEIGNHTLTHPCSGNFSFARNNPLEQYTLDRMAGELDEASSALVRLLGASPETFAYPCGQQFVGRGSNVQSYVPLVARRFSAGRGWRDERHNPPGFCDLARLYAVAVDCLTFDEVRYYLDAAFEEGGWLVLAGHDVGAEPTTRQVVLESTLAELCRFATQSHNGLWLDTVASVARYVRSVRGNPTLP